MCFASVAGFVGGLHACALVESYFHAILNVAGQPQEEGPSYTAYLVLSAVNFGIDCKVVFGHLGSL